MNYLVTHYKNLAEQLQARINHLKQCLYEMDATAAAGGGLNQVRADTSANNMIQPTLTVGDQIQSGDNAAPWDRGTPNPKRTYIWQGYQFKFNNGTWYILIDGKWIDAFEYGLK
jgi:hypothetical protein